MQELIEDDEITEIMINGTDHIFVEKQGKILELEEIYHRDKTGRCDSADCSGFKPDCKRSFTDCGCKASGWFQSNVVLYPVALNGPIVTIRKFRKNITMEQLVQWEAVGPELVPFLKRLMEAKYNIFISGGTGSGKPFLNALSDFIPKDERIITIEDNAELRIQNVPNLVRLEARNANVEGTGEITIRDLIKSALRMRPSRIIVGEVRGREAIDMLQSLNTGHCGASSGHSNSPEDMLSRLETMVLMGMDIPLAAIQRQIAAGIDIIIHLGRLRDRSRKLLQIVEVLGYEEGKIQLQTLYEFQETKMVDGKIKGEWVKLHEIQNQEKLLAAGHSQA
ncbi:MAG: CpaF family protein [[Clostridium] nexile]